MYAYVIIIQKISGWLEKYLCRIIISLIKHYMEMTVRECQRKIMEICLRTSIPCAVM